MRKDAAVYWHEEGVWLGYLRDYPNCWTQGRTLQDLKEHLDDLGRDLDRKKISLGSPFANPYAPRRPTRITSVH